MSVEHARSTNVTRSDTRGHFAKCITRVHQQSTEYSYRFQARNISPNLPHISTLDTYFEGSFPIQGNIYNLPSKLK